VVTTRTAAGRHPKIVERVGCRTTPGQDIDVLVTERGVAVNPARPGLARRLSAAGLPLRDIADLLRPDAPPASRRGGGEPRVVQLYRDGSVLDIVRAP